MMPRCFKYLKMTVFLGSLTFLSGIAAADIYSYKDSKGVLHLTNKKKSTNKKPRVDVTIPDTPSPANDWKSEDVIHLINRVCLEEGVDPALARAVARAESGYRQSAVSRKGAIGVMQLLPETAKRFDVTDILAIEDNVKGGVKYLKYLMDLFAKDMRLAVAAYNAGENRVIKAGGIPNISETVNYVDIVLDYYSKDTGINVHRPIRRFIDENGCIHLTNY